MNTIGYLKKLKKRLESLLPDKVYLSYLYYRRLKRKMHWNDPKSFSEKLQWIKVYDRKPEYTTMVDKYEAKNYVAAKIGAQYIIPTFGVWEKVEDIDFDALPNRFVLKCTHDSGGLVVCRDKQALDIDKAKQKIEACLKNNYYLNGREWPYKNVKARIIAEQYMEETNILSPYNQGSLTDYKFYCFNGEPKFLYISHGLENHATASISFLTMDWQFADYERSDYAPFKELPPKPLKYEEMISICKKLSAGIPFIRVDLYEIDGNVYFSELTFSPCNGMIPFRNPAHDFEIGKMLTLPDKAKKDA